eukprot:g47658.t1
MDSPAELVLDDHGLDAGSIGSFKNADISMPVFPADMENPSQTALMIFIGDNVHTTGKLVLDKMKNGGNENGRKGVGDDTSLLDSYLNLKGFYGGIGSIPEIVRGFFFVPDFQDQLLEMMGLVMWCNENNLSLKHSTTKELIINFRKKGRAHASIYINGIEVGRVDYKKLKKIVCTAQTITEANFPSMNSIYTACCHRKMANISKDPLHP